MQTDDLRFNMQTDDLLLVSLPQLSPAYCTDCIDPSGTAVCFNIPHLDTDFFLSQCNLVSYISATAWQELDFIKYLTQSWLGQQAPLPTTQEWLDTHVHEDSPAYEKLASA